MDSIGYIEHITLWKIKISRDLHRAMALNLLRCYIFKVLVKRFNQFNTPPSARKVSVHYKSNCQNISLWKNISQHLSAMDVTFLPL